MKLQMSRRVLSGIVILALLFCSSLAIQQATFAHAANGEDISPIIHYKGQIPDPTVSTLQGKLMSVTFALYDAEDEGKELWRETQDIPLPLMGRFMRCWEASPYSQPSQAESMHYSPTLHAGCASSHTMATNSSLLNR